MCAVEHRYSTVQEQTTLSKRRRKIAARPVASEHFAGPIDEFRPSVRTSELHALRKASIEACLQRMIIGVATIAANLAPPEGRVQSCVIRKKWIELLIDE